MSPEQTEIANNWLASAGLRPTRQRVVLAALLVGDGRNRHVTAEGLHTLACRQVESVSLATVYNTLRTFCDAGLVKEIIADGHRSWFDTRVDDHPHYFWEDAREVTDAPKESLRISELPEPPEGTEISEIDVVIRLRSK